MHSGKVSCHRERLRDLELTLNPHCMSHPLDMHFITIDIPVPRLAATSERRKRGYDLRVRRAEFSAGDRVWYYTPRRYKGKSPKWQRMCTGPFVVDGQVGPVNYRIRKSTNSRPFIVHVDKLRPCFGEGLSEDEEKASPDLPDNAIAQVARPRRTIRRPVRFQ